MNDSVTIGAFLEGSLIYKQVSWKQCYRSYLYENFQGFWLLTQHANFQALLLQGAATTIYAATAPGLEQQSGAYLYDCQVQQSSKLGQDMDLAAKLWATTEQQLDQVLRDGKLQ